MGKHIAIAVACNKTLQQREHLSRLVRYLVITVDERRHDELTNSGLANSVITQSARVCTQS